ncbi:MAG: phosphatidate cytidylyltransferase [Acutalibacteraceae bacterium]
MSPNKTWAGFLAGPVGSGTGMVLLGLVAKLVWQMELPLWFLAVIGVVANLFGQLGDLSTSLIEREAGIKDYSHIFLTHGGVLDRFDSTLFIAPVVYAMLFVLEKL